MSACKTRRLGLAVCGAFTLLVRSALAPLAAGSASEMAVGSWTTEQFGSDVAVLRSEGGATSPRAAVFLLSCSGPDRRFRLVLPDPIAATASQGRALITPLDPKAGSHALAPFQLANASTILMAAGTPQTRDIPLAIGRMLLTKPRGLDIVLSVGSSPVAFTRLKVIRVLLSLRPEDTEALTRFVDACGRFPATQAN